jgi:hypothetical protein
MATASTCRFGARQGVLGELCEAPQWHRVDVARGDDQLVVQGRHLLAAVREDPQVVRVGRGAARCSGGTAGLLPQGAAGGGCGALDRR